MLRDSGSIPGSGRSPGIGNATHSSILAWRISWTEETGGLRSIGSQRVRHGLKWLSTAQHKTTSITSQFLQHKVWTEISLIPWNHQTSWMLFFFYYAFISVQLQWCHHAFFFTLVMFSYVFSFRSWGRSCRNCVFHSCISTAPTLLPCKQKLLSHFYWY